MRKRPYLLKMGLAAALIGTSFTFNSCGGDGDDPQPTPQVKPNPDNPGGSTDNPGGNTDKPNPDNPGNDNSTPDKPEVVLVSELKCTVAEFATKYQTLKKGEPVSVTLTDVSDANIAQVSETLKNMSAQTLAKAGETGYILRLVLESISNALKTIPADTFKGVEVLREVVIPACVEVIQSDAFAECVNLVSAKILGADTKVDEKAFENANAEIKVEQVAPDGKSLKFDGNGYKLGTEPSVQIFKESTSLPDAGTMQRPGFNFLGWAKAADAKTADFESGASFGGDAEVLYAVWKPYQFLITYHEENGSVWGEDLLSGTKLEKEEYVLRTPFLGYSKIFKGWKDGDGNLYQPGSPITIFHDCDLYQVWEDVDNKFDIDRVPVIYY